MDSIQSSRVFGEYIIKRKIGAGGMASVFYAVHGESNQEVALKILHEHYADDNLIRKRLEHEARIVMRLNHPNIVPVMSFGETDKRPYLVMPYYSGGSLAEYFSKPRTVKHETTLKLLTILASALDYAHSQEVVHRDFKLENILIGPNNLPAISDFGIAQSAHTTRITMTGQILGTPQYLAPETLDTNGKLNYKADYYALAVMAYLMLTGYFPFTALDPLSLAIKHRTEHAPSPSVVNSALPTTVDEVFKRGLAKDPDERYPKAKDFVAALDDAFTYAAIVTTQIFLFEQNPVPATQAAMAQAGIITPDMTDPDAYITRVLPHDDVIPAVAPASVEKRKKRPAALYLTFLTLLLCTSASMVVFLSNGGTSMIFADDGVEAERTSEPFLNLPLGEETETVELQAIANSPQTEESLATEESAETEDAAASPTARPSRTARPSNGSATATVRATSTARAGNSATPHPTNTPRPAASNTPQTLPTNTPRPLPTNTPQPQPTSVPPTNVPPTNPPPPTSVPPTNPPPPTSVPPTNPPAPTNPPPPPPTTILDPILEPVDTLVPCIPIPLVRTCN